MFIAELIGGQVIVYSDSRTYTSNAGIELVEYWGYLPMLGNYDDIVRENNKLKRLKYAICLVNTSKYCSTPAKRFKEI